VNILFAPYNIASMQEITADALSKINGNKVKCLYFGKHKYNSFSPNSIVFYAGKNKLLRWFYKLYGFFFLVRLIIWADVIHWVWDSAYPRNIDLWLCRFFKKKTFVEWVGSDIRVPEVLIEKNPWYAHAFQNGYEYAKDESLKKSYQVQERFKKNGFIPVLVPEMKLYLQPGLFDRVYDTQYRIDTKKYTPLYPDPQKRKPLIVHSPSAKIAKGSNLIDQVIKRLQKQYDFEYIEIHNCTHEECLSYIQKSDIFIDQIIIGSYAMAALEAMSFGKPVFGFLMEDIVIQYKEPICPIVNVNGDTLEDILAMFIQNGELRYQTGLQSRSFVEVTHDSNLLAQKLMSIYKDTI
jgi:glycosyltransferase involved in cell wall biosynthesis